MATITTLCLLTGVAIQPLARRIDVRHGGNRRAVLGLAILVAGLALGAATAAARYLWWPVPCAIVLAGGSAPIVGVAAGAALLVAALVTVERRAAEEVLPLRLFANRIFSVVGTPVMAVGMYLLSLLGWPPRPPSARSPCSSSRSASAG